MRSESCTFIWHPKVVTWYFTAPRIERAAGARALADLENAPHPSLGVARHRAEELVAAGFQVSRDGCAGLGHRLGLRKRLAALLDRHVVGNDGGVVELDRDRARIRLERGLVECEVGLVGGELEGGRGGSARSATAARGLASPG